MSWTFPKLVSRSAPVILLVLTLAAAIAFAAVVVVTMFASRGFDPRVMWDAAAEAGR